MFLLGKWMLLSGQMFGCVLYQLGSFIFFSPQKNIAGSEQDSCLAKKLFAFIPVHLSSSLLPHNYTSLARF